MKRKNEKFNFTFVINREVRDGVQCAYLSVYYVESDYDRKYPPGRELFSICMQRNTDKDYGRSWYGHRLESCSLDSYSSHVAVKLLAKIVAIREKGTLNLKSILKAINGVRIVHSRWINAPDVNGQDFWMPRKYKRTSTAFRVAFLAGIL